MYHHKNYYFETRMRLVQETIWFLSHKDRQQRVEQPAPQRFFVLPLNVSSGNETKWIKPKPYYAVSGS